MRRRVVSRAAVLAASLHPANHQGARLRSRPANATATTTRREPHFEEFTIT